MGALYRGQVWWVKYYVNGRPMRESTSVSSDNDTPPNEARRFLKVKEGKAARGRGAGAAPSGPDPIRRGRRGSAPAP